MKIKMMFDSSVGMSKQEIESKGAIFSPIIIEIDGKDYEDGVNIDEAKLEDFMNNGEHIYRTAAISQGRLAETFREGLKEADAIVFLPISKGLSSSYNNAAMVAKEEEFKGKVFVIESLYASP
jgi:fatty acid-binding protein DegV